MGVRTIIDLPLPENQAVSEGRPLTSTNFLKAIAIYPNNWDQPYSPEEEVEVST